MINFAASFFIFQFSFMMRNVFFLLLIALAVLPLSLLAQEATVPTTQPAPKLQTIYVFGVSQNLSDSIIYVSDITELTAADLLDKKHFLLHREAYSSQFAGFLADKFGTKHQTAAVFFALSKNKAQSKRLQLNKKLTQRKHQPLRLEVKEIAAQEFQFRTAASVAASVQ